MIKLRSKDEKQAIAVRSFSLLKQEEEVIWLELDLEHQIKYFKSLLLSEKFYDQKMLLSYKNGNKDDAATATTSDNDNDDDDDDDDDDDGGDRNSTSSDDKSPHSEIEKEIVESEPLASSLTIEAVKLITVVDTGGQPEYIHLLPAINSYPTVTFLVHDLTKKLDDPVQVRYKQKGCEEAPIQVLKYSHLDMIHLLMSFVTDSLECPPA